MTHPETQNLILWFEALHDTLTDARELVEAGRDAAEALGKLDDALQATNGAIRLLRRDRDEVLRREER